MENADLKPETDAFLAALAAYRESARVREDAWSTLLDKLKAGLRDVPQARGDLLVNSAEGPVLLRFRKIGNSVSLDVKPLQ